MEEEKSEQDEDPCNKCPLYCENCVIAGRIPPCQKKRDTDQ
jgi:late competence protein required for DNA uptake (superfamily II DNA/RNA helicase)